VAHDQRAPGAPDVPTTREAGAPYFRVLGGLGLFASSATAPELREMIARDVTEVVGDPDVSGRIIALGEIPRSATPPEFAALLAEQAKWYSEMAAANGIKPQP
jgi:tripartite-type tricarboxylate transporter receptor subunit TctC